MKPVSVLLALALAGCGASAPQVAEHTFPDPLALSELPDPPGEPANHVAVPVESCVGDDGAQVGPGIMLSPEMAAHAARVRVKYDELRSMYTVDLRTEMRERQIYQRELDMADDEADRLRQEAHRSWWERNSGVLGLAAGIIVGAGLTIGVLAATDGVRP